MNILVAGTEMAGLPGISDALDRLGCMTCILVGEADILQALSFVRFDAMVVDLDTGADQVIDIVKLHRFAAIGETPLPVIGLAKTMTPAVERAAGEGTIDRLLPKPLDPIELHGTLFAAIASSKHSTAANSI